MMQRRVIRDNDTNFLPDIYLVVFALYIFVKMVPYYKNAVCLSLGNVFFGSCIVGI